MGSGVIIVFGVLYALLLVGAAANTVERKAPWREFAHDAGILAAWVGGAGWLAHSVWAWILDGGMGLAFVLIGLGLAFVRLVICALGAAVGLLQPRG